MSLLAGVLALACAGLFLPSVQRVLLRRALVWSGATHVRVGHFHATPFGLTVEQIAFQRGPCRVDARDLTLIIVPWRVLWRRLECLRIHAGAIEVWYDVDTPRGSATATSTLAGQSQGEASAVSTVLQKLRSPFPLWIAEADLAGRLTLLHGSAPIAEGKWTLHGGRIAPNRTGSFEYRIDLFRMASGSAASAHVDGLLTAAEGLSGEWHRLGLQGHAGIRQGSPTSRALNFQFEIVVGSGITVRIDHFPIDGLNPLLGSHDFHFDPGEMSGAWTAEMSGNEFALIPLQSLVVPAIRIEGARIPEIGPLRLQADPRVEFSGTVVRLRIENCHIENERGRRVDAMAEVAFAPDGHSVELKAFTISLRRAAKEEPVLLATLLRPWKIEPSDLAAGLKQVVPGDLLRVKAHGLPLGWLSLGLPGRTIEGTLADAESTVRSVAGGALALDTPSPWRLTGLRFIEGGRQYFCGNLSISPAVSYGPEERSIRLSGISADDVRGYHLRGKIGVGFRNSDTCTGGGVSLEAELPPFPGVGQGSGPLRVSLSAVAHAFPGSKFDLSHFALTVSDSKKIPRFSVSAAQSISIERTENAEWLFNSPQPLRFTTRELPLARLNPLLESRNIRVDGILPPTELRLWLSPRRIRLESMAPLALDRFCLERGGEVLIDRALLRTGISLDLGVEHRLLPAFQMKSTAVFRLSDGIIEAGGSRVARFDAQIGGSGTERGGSLRDLSGSLWLDLGALGRMPALAQIRLPATGTLTFSIKKSQDKAQTVEFDGKIDGLVGRNGLAIPALVLTGRAGGDLNQRIGGFSVRTTLLSSPRPSDLHFGIRINYSSLSILDLSSKLEGSYVDVDEIRKFAAAFARAVSAPTSVKSPDGTGSSPAAARSVLARAAATLRPAESPPWGGLRGHFVLAIKTLKVPPYTVENLGGRLDATPDSLILSNLSGDILGGRGSADIAAQFRRGDPEGEEAFDAHFGITRLDAGRAVRMRFPNPAAGIDGRFDLDVSIASRANRWEDLISQASGRFTMAGHEGRVRFALPKEEMLSSALIIGGTVTFSSEMRALSRLVRQLSDIPIDQLQASGTLGADGQLHLERLRLESRDLRLSATGRIADAKSKDLMGQSLSMQATLAARGDIAVILGGMRLLGEAETDGYRSMNQSFNIAGNVGQPDFHPLYDLFARAVSGSRGTWGMLMRKVQAEVAKRRTGG